MLKKLYQVHLSQNMHLPIERMIVNIMDEVPLPDLGNNMVVYDDTINFYRPIDQYPPYADVSQSLILRRLVTPFDFNFDVSRFVGCIDSKLVQSC